MSKMRPAPRYLKRRAAAGLLGMTLNQFDYESRKPGFPLPIPTAPGEKMRADRRWTVDALIKFIGAGTNKQMPGVIARSTATGLVTHVVGATPWDVTWGRGGPEPPTTDPSPSETTTCNPIRRGVHKAQ